MEDRGFRALCAGFVATLALFARVGHAVPATFAPVDGTQERAIVKLTADALHGSPAQLLDAARGAIHVELAG